MPTTPDLEDDRLVELLDEALCELRSGRPLDTLAWHQRHPELGNDGASLLATMVRFATSADEWLARLPRPPKSDRTNRGTAADDSPLPESLPKSLPESLPGQIGRYVILEKLGTGAMGTVYRAHDPQLDRLVAVKIPRLDKVPKNRQEFTERFLREARHAAAVRHPHICPIYDAGRHDDHPYVVMAYVDGEPLDVRLLRIGQFENVRVAVRLAIQVAQALAAVHVHAIIHRDLKPANILLDRAGQALLTDFGLAREIETGEKLTTDGIVVGTPSYMSPEQASGANSSLGPAADIYSLGIVLYEMLAGQLPFRGSVCEVLRRIVVEPPASPAEHRPDLDPRLAQLVLKAIAKNPADRFPSAENFASALQGWLESAAVSTERDLALAGLPIRRDPASPVATLSATIPAGRIRKFRTSTFVKTALVLVVAGFGLLELGRRFELGRWSPNSVAEKKNEFDSLPHANPRLPAPAALKGEVEITVWSDPDKIARGVGVVKSGVPVSRSDSGALPLQNGELVHLQARLNRPAYVYLVWIGSDGRTIPLFPWDADHSEALWDAPLVKEAGMPSDNVNCPGASNRGFVATGSPGMQHVVLLARSSPLEAPGKKLRAALADLPACPLVNSREVAYLEWSRSAGSKVRELRGIIPGKTKEFNAPVFDILKERLEGDFELIKVWRFAQVDELQSTN